MTRRLHLSSAWLGTTVTLTDKREFVVFRTSTKDAAPADRPVLLEVWFHLRSIPAGARWRRYVFERACLFNTLLFAGCDGFLVKLWMVDPATSDYAGMYSWESADSADRYGRYITSILRPLCPASSVGYRVRSDLTLDEHLQHA